MEVTKLEDIAIHTLIRTFTGSYYLCWNSKIFYKIQKCINEWLVLELTDSSINFSEISDYWYWDNSSVNIGKGLTPLAIRFIMNSPEHEYNDITHMKLNTVKEMTVEEISEKLGYKIKIVKEYND